LVLQIPAIVVSLFIFAYFITHRGLLRFPQNQALLLLLVVNFIQVSCDLPMPIHFYQLGYVIPATAAYCTWWTFFEYTLSAISEFLMATISIQRHMLVFNSHILRIQWKRYLLHDLPLLLCVVYPTILYLILVVFYPCDGTQWDFTLHLCGAANCYLLYNKTLATLDWVIDSGLPILLILLANGALVVRVVWQKHHHVQLRSWRKQRRLTLQLVAISSLYLIAWLPSTGIALVELLGSPTFLAEFQSNYALDLIYLVCLFLPWICLGQIRKLTVWISGKLHCQQAPRNAIGPTQSRHVRNRR
jgi:hypothetical protein